MSTDGIEPEREVEPSAAYKRDLKRLKKRGRDLDRIAAVVETIRVGSPLAVRHHDHALSGDLKGYRDCHVEPDWILVYRVAADVVFLFRTGTHSDLFG